MGKLLIYYCKFVMETTHSVSVFKGKRLLINESFLFYIKTQRLAVGFFCLILKLKQGMSFPYLSSK
jgi:hypothetical protein